MAYTDPASGGFGSSDNPDLSNSWKQDRYNSWQSSQGGSGSGGGSSFEDTVAKAIKMQQDANKPAIQSLQNSIPEIQQRYESDSSYLKGQQQPLEDRYQQLLSDITGQKTTSVNKATLNTAQEFGKRGVPLSSGAYGQELGNVVNPIEQQYTSLYNQTGIQRESDIKALQKQLTDLGFSETDALRAVNNSIAQLQAGAASSGISQGVSQYNTTQANNQWQQGYDLQKSQLGDIGANNAADLALKQLQLKSNQLAYQKAAAPATATPNLLYTVNGSANNPASLLNQPNPAGNSWYILK